MAHSTNLNIRLDNELKKEAERLFTDIGLSMTAAITLFLKQSVSNEGIPFEIRRRNGFYNKYNQMILKTSIDQLNNGEAGIHETIEVADE
ncbi:MAG: type II toxin-antitoxin system RelB/DinJ family antitoxin [Bacillota bacterium]|nr:type II toxin-antitoxin system RelB/DinJ family antitoxin [Bacillota bacterium]